MITMGDEVARSQRGSNNAYSMPAFMHPNIDDSPETFMGGWALSWSRDEQQQDLRQSVIELIRIRDTYLADIASEFFTGRMDLGTRRKDIAWFSLNGNEMTEDRWEDGARRTLTVFIEAGPRQGLLLLLNSERESAMLTLPGEQWGSSFRRIFDASSRVETHEPIIKLPSEQVAVSPHCAQVWLVTRS
jgi:glycogen operon protein